MNNEELKQAIRQLCRDKQAVVMAHYYTRPEIQDVADFIGDSLALARRAAETDARIIVMCGVHFMAETCKLLCPDRLVLCPDPEAGCSLADSCTAEELRRFKAEHPGHTVISYVNTTAAVKALTDIVVTSGNAERIVRQLPEDEKIIFGPDRNLGSYINAVTGRNMLLWQGGCHVHARFTPVSMSPSERLFIIIAITSESIVVWNTALFCISSSRNCLVFIRLPLCARAIFPHLPVNTMGWALSSWLAPVVE